MWEAMTGNTITSYNGNGVWFCGLAWSNDGQRFVAAGTDSSVRVFDAGSGNVVYSINANGLQDVAWSPDGKLIGAGESGQVELLTAASGSSVYTHPGQSGNILVLAWSPDSKRIASGSDNGSIQVWQAQ